MTIFERKLPTEEADAAAIVRGILKVQAAFAAAQKRPLGRGTHTKGICARATFEVFDLRRTLGDHTLASRLAQGLYAKPGVYNATVRFANAASTFYPDRAPDLRAMSFSVEMPPGMDSETDYQDYSMQTAPVFPINDSHSFAVLMSVLSAGSGANKLKAIAALSFLDFCGFVRSAVLGGLQQRGKTGAYQKNRYWSTVPFRNGPDEAVQYSAIPSPNNPAHALHGKENDLQHELIRHLNEDQQMSSFEIALQLLEPQRMTRWGFRRDPSFWIENATVKWNESQAPFYTVGRLTLLPKSVMPQEDGVPRAIDVTDHSTIDTRPLGSINRVRHAAEVASKEVRLGLVSADAVMDQLPQPARGPRSRLVGLLKLAALGVVAMVAAYPFVGVVYRARAARNIPAFERIDEVRYLNQGWGPERESVDRETYYYTPQGAGMHHVRYSWFVHLERPFSRARFADPDHLRSLNFIVDPVATHANPDQLPIGFARHYDEKIQDDVVDITCAACHNGQLNITKNGKTTGIRIDGGPSLNAFTDSTVGSFQVDLVLSLIDTYINPFKFNRFAARVLGPDANTMAGKWNLWSNLGSVVLELLKVSGGSSAKKLYPVQEGYGRTDALARIANVVFGDHISPANYRTGDAPVSYPYVWNIWKFDWVQYGASVSQPMARNVGEGMGVGSDYAFLDDYGRPVPKSERYRSSTSFDNLVRLESTMQKLTPPRWPEDLLGDIKPERRHNGEKLFKQHCVGCHGPHVASRAYTDSVAPGRLANDPTWVIRTLDVKDIGTDPNAANNFAFNRINLAPIGVTFDEVKPLLKKEWDTLKDRQAAMLKALPLEIARRKAAGADPAVLSEFQKELNDAQQAPVTDEFISQQLDAIDFRRISSGAALNILGMLIRDRYYTDNHFSPEARSCFEGFGTVDLPQVLDAYKPRPLEGVWATPPFLHNGSVPNIYELLSPVSERSQSFFVGRREFDPVKVGFVTQPAQGTSGGFWLNTKLPGNRNTGHEFRKGYKPFDESKPASEQLQGGAIGPELTPDERLDIIEYLKVHRDDAGPQDRKPVDCFSLLK